VGVASGRVKPIGGLDGVEALGPLALQLIALCVVSCVRVSCVSCVCRVVCAWSAK
jgi:hypothetical protein